MATRMLTLDDLEAYLALCAAQDAESGRDGDPYHGPYSIAEPFDLERRRQRTREGWSKTLRETGWRRAWGSFDGPHLVGSATATGGALVSELHRVMLGMGVLRGHRRQGRAERLLRAVIAWSRAEPSIAWLDLGVFSDNAPARALYDKLGFRAIGRTEDRWRMDGHRIDDVMMTTCVEETEGRRD